MLIKDKLTRQLDRYNDSKLKRMYKLIGQDMLHLYKRAKSQDDRIAGWLKLVQDAEANDEVIAKGMDLAGCIQ